MAGIFISYRRADSDGWAGRLRDALRARFGNRVFQDVESIADGEIFSEVIDRALQECDVALIIIGPNWASASDGSGRRLDQPDDWVRTETALVLNRKIRVIPVLVGGASMPRADDLPEELRSLTKRQAREIRSNSWDSDVALLASHLRQIVRHGRKRPPWHYALASVIVAAIGAFAGSWFFGQPVLTPAETVATSPPAAQIKREEATPPASNAGAASKPGTTDTPSEKQAASVPAKVKPPPDTSVAVGTSSKPGTSDTPSEKAASVQPAKMKPPPEPSVAAGTQASSRSPTGSTTTASGKPQVGPLRATEPDRPTVARTPPKSAKAETDAPSQEPRKPTVVQAEAQPVPPPPAPPAAVRRQAPPSVPAATPEVVAHAAPLNLPNRPAAARELKIGDSWTYRLREVRYDKNLATVTHEIGGGDKSGIREVLRIGGRKSGSDSGAEAAATQRRLTLEPRIFEQQLDQNATLYEFSPFMTAFSELQPGVRWSKIDGAKSSDSINDWRFSGKVTGRERVRVPAGNFDAIKAELEGQLDISFPSTRDPFSETAASYQTYSVWFVPEIGRAIKYERRTYNRGRRLLEHEQYELMSYRLN